MEVTNYREEINGTQLAKFDCYVPAIGLTLHNLKVVARKKGGWFVAFPNYCIEINGEKLWKPYYSFTKDRMEQFSKALDLLLEPLVRMKREEGPLV